MEVPQHFAIVLPLLAAGVSLLMSLIVHALSLQAVIRFVRRERKIGFAGVKFWRNVVIVATGVLVLMVAHLLEILIWACMLRLCGASREMLSAFYYSAGSYTTLGTVGVAVDPSWRLIGPLEAANGMLMFGVSTAITFSVIERLIRLRTGEID